MQIEFISPDASLDRSSAHVVLAFDDAALSAEARAADLATAGAITRAIGNSRFSGSKGQVLDIISPHGLKAARLVVVGVGGSAPMEETAGEIAGGEAYKALKTSGVADLVLDFGPNPFTAARAAFGVKLAAYRFDRYRTKEKADARPSILRTRIIVSDPNKARLAFADLEPLADGVLFARDLVSEPSNILHPAAFAMRVKELESLGLEVEILGESDLAALGMGALLGVGQGSERESQLAVIRWSGGPDPKSPPVCFVGKGVCFDTGGISIKPSAGMEEMKTDMAGAAAVAGVMHTLAGRKARVNAVGVLGLVENMPDGAAQRPGDVVISLSGQTIEVIDTDAEGRLVLADALWYAQDRFKPRIMVDLATLTGAVIIALGNDIAGLFSNDDDLAEGLLAAGKAEREILWRLPLPEVYEKMIDTPVADMKNLAGRPASSITAALFLQRFVNGTPWAHLDIAATAWRKEPTDPTTPEGASGYGVRLLNRLVASNFEHAPPGEAKAD